VIQHTSDIRVRYADTDQMKFAYYGRFFEYFEQGRSDLLRTIGLPYGVLEDLGYFLPVIEAHAEYKRPARFDDLLHVLTILRDRPVARVRIDYEVRCGDAPDLVAEGYTIHSFLHAKTGKPSRAPAQFLEAIEHYLRGEQH
jgi:acyl-CoA thioester hydrolase